jgi:hypothetical protein
MLNQHKSDPGVRGHRVKKPLEHLQPASRSAHRNNGAVLWRRTGFLLAGVRASGLGFLLGFVLFHGIF